MPRYINTGGPIDRVDGSWIEMDEEFEPTPQELVQYAHKLAPVEEAGALFEDPETHASVRWPMAMHPSLYLRIYPQGPHAEAAKQVLVIEAKRLAAQRPKRIERARDAKAAIAAKPSAGV